MTLEVFIRFWRIFLGYVHRMASLLFICSLSLFLSQDAYLAKETYPSFILPSLKHSRVSFESYKHLKSHLPVKLVVEQL